MGQGKRKEHNHVSSDLVVSEHEFSFDDWLVLVDGVLRLSLGSAGRNTDTYQLLGGLGTLKTDSTSIWSRNLLLGEVGGVLLLSGHFGDDDIGGHHVA